MFGADTVESIDGGTEVEEEETRHTAIGTGECWFSTMRWSVDAVNDPITGTCTGGATTVRGRASDERCSEGAETVSSEETNARGASGI